MYLLRQWMLKGGMCMHVCVFLTGLIRVANNLVWVPIFGECGAHGSVRRWYIQVCACLAPKADKVHTEASIQLAKL